MNIITQKYIIERLLASPDIFSRCIGIISSEYFDPELRPLIKFITEYFAKYSSIPKLEYLNAEFDSGLKVATLEHAETKFICDEIELFCRQSALYKAIVDSAPDVTSGNDKNFGKVLERVQDALAVSIQKELGVEMYEKLEERLALYMNSDLYEPTGINGLDAALGGGFARKQLTLFSANSGGGKSLMMSNIAANYSRRGFHVLQLALELTEQMIDLRNLSIMTGVPAGEWKHNITSIIDKMNAHKLAGAGSFIVKRIPGGSTAIDIRSYLKLYETEYGFVPDVLIVDYLDLMSPNGGSRNKGIFEQDKEKAEELVELAYDYNCITITASQQNRDGMRSTSPDQTVIAGGVSKVYTVDNYISIYMNPEMRIKGEMFLYYLKTRSSSAVGSITHLCFNPDNLIISDTKTTTVNVIAAIKERGKTKGQPIQFPGTPENIGVPDEFADIISRYHENDINVRKTYDTDIKQRNVDLSDDIALWDNARTKEFKLSPNDNYDELIDFMGTI